MAGWLRGWVAGWLVESLVGWSGGWLIGWLIGLQADRYPNPVLDLVLQFAHLQKI